MMNLEILLFAALRVDPADCNGCTQSDRDRLVHIAETHANTTAAHHVRPDGSVHHIVCYDNVTGAERFTCNGGAWVDNSTWARGQAWAVYGYTMMHRYTGKPFYLTMAQKLADFYLARMDAAFPDSVPNFDLTFPLGPLSNLTNRDASAAAIAASGLLELANATRVANPQVAMRYRAHALNSLAALGGNVYRSDWNLQEGAVQHCNAQNTDVPWADYYLLEAIARTKAKV